MALVPKTKVELIKQKYPDGSDLVDRLGYYVCKGRSVMRLIIATQLAKVGLPFGYETVVNTHTHARTNARTRNHPHAHTQYCWAASRIHVYEMYDVLDHCEKNNFALDVNKSRPLSNDVHLPPIAHATNRTADLTEIAAGSADEKKQLEALKFLLEYKADSNAAGRDGDRALHFARTPAVATFLLEAKASIDAVNNAGDTALMTAARNARAQVAMVLLEAGANTTSKTRQA